jgi:hypothetical protein
MGFNSAFKGLISIKFGPTGKAKPKAEKRFTCGTHLHCFRRIFSLRSVNDAVPEAWCFYYF